MKFSRQDLEGVCLIESDVFIDARGHFSEIWAERKFKEAQLNVEFVQDNISFSKRGVIRGLHFQNPFSQTKLVRVLAGEIFDVVVDLRQQSPTFKQWRSFSLSSENHHQLLIPSGFAHGFQVLSDTALVFYKSSTSYTPAAEKILNWSSPELKIVWPIANPCLSSKDASGKPLSDFKNDELFG